MYKKVLVAYDGSEKAHDAFRFALEMAVNCPDASTKLVVVSVAQMPEPMDYVEMNPGAIMDGITKYYEDLFKGLKSEAEKKGVKIDTKVIAGHPADMVVKYAQENGCDMIVIGHRGRSKVADWLLGSVSRRVASYSHCSVTIVK